MTAFFICEMDVGDFTDIVYGPSFRTREEAEKEVQELRDNPKCEISFYVKELEAGTKTVNGK